ncbi:MAG TPA: YbaN family protein [Blastocatellia bacterium]|nr:YbaN family protein [Blastocatellia bacterium]
MKLRRNFYLISGFTLVGLGIAGAILPLLPTTPFLLLAAYCFARSSERWHEWLLNHRIFGSYIRAFRERRGLTKAQKSRIAVTVTLTLAISFLVAPGYLKLIPAGIWFIGMCILYFSRTAKDATLTPAVSPDTHSEY